MIRILLDNHPAIPADNAGIKLTIENPYFTRSGSYTYDVEFPLTIPENRAIFGLADRMDTPKETRIFEASIIVDNVNVLSGVANITGFTEKSVRVQILGGEAAHNFTNKQELYIDELDLGAWDDLINTTDELPWVTYPTYNTTMGAMCNPARFLETAPHSGVFDLDITGNCKQPFLWCIAHLIAGATGFQLDIDDNALFTDERYRFIFITSTSPSPRCIDSLPHWTVNEWWSAIEDAFGVIVAVDYQDMRLRIKSRSDVYDTEREVINLALVVDEYTVDTTSDGGVTVATSNVEFADAEISAYSLLPESIIREANYNDDFESPSDLASWFSGKSEADMASVKDVIFRCGTGEYFIYVNDLSTVVPGASGGGLVEVNMCRSRSFADKEGSNDVQLRFVPASLRKRELDFHTYGYGDHPKSGSIEAHVISCEGVDTTDTSEGKVNIEAVLDQVDDEPADRPDKPDTIYIAVNDVNGELNQEVVHSYFDHETGDRIDTCFNVPLPGTVERLYCHLQGTFFRGNLTMPSLTIHGAFNRYTPGVLAPVDTIKIKDSVKYCISFITGSIPRVDSIFLIRNREFLCEKIEVDIDNRGFRKLMRGYFYEVESKVALEMLH